MFYYRPDQRSKWRDQMIKNTLMAFIFACLVPGFVSVVRAENLTADSKISSVTVYPGAARITREAKINVASGTHSIVFENIVPSFDENSLTVSGSGTAKIKIFGGYLKQDYLKEAADKRVKELQAQIEGVQDQLTAEQARSQVINDQKEFLNSLKLYSNQQLPKDLATKMPTTAELDEMVKFIGTSREGLDKTDAEVRLKIRSLNRDIEKLNNELALLHSGGTKLQRSIVVDFECTQAGTFNAQVSYMVNGAYWHAIYDARSDMSKGEVELASFGTIKQTTGEDWKDVQLTLSTAQPTIGGRMPYVAPWILSEQQVYPQSQMPRKAKMATMVSSEMASGGMQYAAFDAVAPTAMPEEKEADVAYANVAQSGVSVTYKIARPVTILSDGSESKLPINTQTLKANFEYSSYPKASNFAYLGSRVTNANDLQLLAGPVNLFLGDEFVGKSSIDAIGPGQDFDLYLGIDENVKVKREQVEKKIDETLIGGIQSPNRKTTFKYKLSVENFTSKPITVKLFDAMPVAQNDKIKVKVFDVSLQPTAKDWQDRKGVWQWELKLAPKAKQEIFYSFVVEHPRDMNVGGL